MSVREAVMSNAANSQVATDSYKNQMPSTQAALEKPKRPQPVQPTFKGENHAPSQSAVRPSTLQPSQASALAGRVNSSSAAAQRGNSAPVNEPVSVPSSSGGFGDFLKKNLLMLLFILFVIAGIIVLVVMLT